MKIISEEVGDVEMTMPPRQDFELPEAVCEATIAVAAAPAFVDHTVSDEFIRRANTPPRRRLLPCTPFPFATVIVFFLSRGPIRPGDEIVARVNLSEAFEIAAADTPPPALPLAHTNNRHVSEAYTISVVRTRTVTALEFFWNIYSVFKSIITTFLGLPGVSMALSTVGANEIMNIPGADHCLTLFENFMSMILLVGSKPG
jgi:hypothetical protein